MAKHTGTIISNGTVEGQLQPTVQMSGTLNTEVLRGYSAYQVAVSQGFNGTQEEWLESLKGDQVQLKQEDYIVYWKYSEDESWNELLDLHSIQSGLMSVEERAKLSGIQEGAQANTITGVKGNAESTFRTGNIDITSENIGLGNVQNKSSETIRGQITKTNVIDALGFTPADTEVVNNKLDKYIEVDSGHILEKSDYYYKANDDGTASEIPLSGMKYKELVLAGEKTKISVTSSNTDIPSVVYQDIDKKWHNVFGSLTDKEYPTSNITKIICNSGAGISDISINAIINQSGAHVTAGHRVGTAVGHYATAEGMNTVSTNFLTHAEGMSTEATGIYSHAEGQISKATGAASHAEGVHTVASGIDAHAEGNYTTASGNSSHAEGMTTTAASAGQHVFGNRNITDPDGKYIEIVGNGHKKAGNETEDTFSNARTLDWSGNQWVAGKISQDGTPTEDKDLATKKYVDDTKYDDTSLQQKIRNLEVAMRNVLFVKDWGKDTSPTAYNTKFSLLQASDIKDQMEIQGQYYVDYHDTMEYDDPNYSIYFCMINIDPQYSYYFDTDLTDTDKLSVLICDADMKLVKQYSGKSTGYIAEKFDKLPSLSAIIFNTKKNITRFGIYKSKSAT